MKAISKALGFVVLTLAVLSCSMIGKLAEKQLDKGLSTQKADSLWSDVPRMDGLNDSPTEDLPLTIKLVYAWLRQYGAQLGQELEKRLHRLDILQIQGQRRRTSRISILPKK